MHVFRKDGQSFLVLLTETSLKGNFVGEMRAVARDDLEECGEMSLEKCLFCFFRHKIAIIMSVSTYIS